MKQRLSLWMMSLLFGILPMTAANVTSDPSVLEFGNMWVEGGFIAKLTQRLCVEVKNTSDKDFYGVWIAVDEEQEASVKISGTPLSGMREFIEIQVNAASTDTIEIYICAPRAGKYKISCANVEPKQLLFNYEMDIVEYQEPQVSGNIKIDMLEQTRKGNVLYCDTYLPRITGTISITNEGEYAIIPQNNPYFKAPVFLESDLQPALSSQTSGRVSIDNSIIKPGETITRTFDFYLAEKPEEGKEYYVVIGILEKPVVSVSFTVRQCTNTYWTADGTAKPLPLSNDSLMIPAEALAVDLRGQHHTNAIYSVDVSEANPNCLYYLEFLDNVPEGFISEANIIRGDEAKTLMVNADYDYFCPMPFKAREAMFVYTPYSEAHGPAKSYMSYPFSGAVVLPFNAQKYWLSALNSEESFYGEDIKMLRYMGIKDSSLIFEPTIPGEYAWSSEPYLISYVKPSPITFYSEDIIVPVCDHVWSGSYEGIPYSFKGSYVETTASEGTFMWSNDKHGFYPCEEGTKIKPFTAVIVKVDEIIDYGESGWEDNESVYFDERGLRIIIRGENADPDGGEAVPEATDIKALRSVKPQANEGGRLPVYSLSGRRVATVESTDSRLEGLKSGMYIIGGKKFIIR